MNQKYAHGKSAYMFGRYRNHQSPALDLYKNSKSKNKNLPFFNYENGWTHSPKNQNLSFVSREMGYDMNGTYY